MEDRYWRDTDVDPDRKRRRQAEFLVKDFCPWLLISDIGVVNSSVKSQAEDILAEAEHKPVINIRREWYY